MARLKRKHIRFAESSKYLQSCTAVPRNAKKSLAKAQRIRKGMGLRARTKIPANTRWSRLTTQLPWCTLYGKDWAKRSVFSKAITLWHELVHARQWRAGHFARYFWAPWRWALEVQAYRGEIRARKAMGQGRATLLKRVDRVVGRLRKIYWLQRLSRGQLEREARRILLAEIDA